MPDLTGLCLRPLGRDRVCAMPAGHRDPCPDPTEVLLVLARATTLEHAADDIVSCRARGALGPAYSEQTERWLRRRAEHIRGEVETELKDRV